MSRKVWFVQWYRPSKVFKDEKVGDFETCSTEEQAKALCKKLKAMEGVTDITVQETECCSL